MFDSSRKIVLVWLPSHVGFPGNTLADKAAREGSVVHPVPNIAVPSSDFLSYVKTEMAHRHQSDWINTPTTNKLRSIRDTTQIWSTSSLASRKEEVVICRLRLGHTMLTHSHLFQKLPPPLCTLCNLPLSIKHILESCPHYNNARIRFNLPPTLSEILGDSISSVNNVLDFLKSANLFLQI